MWSCFSFLFRSCPSACQTLTSSDESMQRFLCFMTLAAPVNEKQDRDYYGLSGFKFHALLPQQWDAKLGTTEDLKRVRYSVCGHLGA